jgi:hypothetical protein
VSSRASRIPVRARSYARLFSEGDVGQRGRVAAAAESEVDVCSLQQRQFIVARLEVAGVCAKVRPGEFRGVVRRDGVGTDGPEFLGDGNAQFVGLLGDADDDIVARLNAGAPVDKHLRVLANAIVHAYRSVRRDIGRVVLAATHPSRGRWTRSGPDCDCRAAPTVRRRLGTVRSGTAGPGGHGRDDQVLDHQLHGVTASVASQRRPRIPRRRPDHPKETGGYYSQRPDHEVPAAREAMTADRSRPRTVSGFRSRPPSEKGAVASGTAERS